MQLRRLRFALGVGISSSCLRRRILWTARLEHLAFEAISLFSNPCVSKVSIKICVATSSGGAIVVDDTKVLSLAGWKKNWEVIAISGFKGTSLYKPHKPHADPAVP